MFLSRKPNKDPKDNSSTVKERKQQGNILERKSFCWKNTLKEKGMYKNVETRCDHPVMDYETLLDRGVCVV